MIIIRNWKKELTSEEYKEWEARAAAKWKEIEENPIAGVKVDPELASFMGLPLPERSNRGITKEDAIRSWIGVERDKDGVPRYVGTKEE